MGIVSYAQNFEDVMLWRALQHLEKGFYVDIGAQDPVVDSVSLAFYEHGWRGVHVEPTSQYSEMLRIARPDEIVIQAAIGSQADLLSFFEFEDTGLSTADPDIACRHKAAGFRCNETKVPVISLDRLFERIGAHDIHWLKLDVEGLEKSVLESWIGTSVLPWVLIIESTRPLTQDENFTEWEHLILSKGYKFVYFDGLNRFYVSPDQGELVQAFNFPPNVFDCFALSGTAQQSFYELVERKAQEAQSRAEQAESRAEQAESRAEQAECIAQKALAKEEDIRLRLNDIYTSTSWKLTKPLRWGVDHIRNRRNLLTYASPKSLSRRVFLHLMRLIKAHPLAKRGAVALASRVGLEGKLGRWYFTLNSDPLLTHPSSAYSPTDVRQLPPRALRVYSQLKKSIRTYQEGST